jgi:acetyl esterase
VIVGLDEAALAESRAFNEAVIELLEQEPSVHLLPPDESRRARREGKSVFPPPDFLPRAYDVAVPTRAGEIRARVVPPDSEVTGVYLYLHGGGWVLGCCDEQDDRLAALADATGLCAVSVDYRLAPEHPYPDGPDDCEDAALWLLERGREELGSPKRFAIGGESAGAHLAVTTLLRLRDDHGISGAFGAANLVFGVYDLSMTPSQRNWGDRYLILSTPMMHWFGRAFIGDRTTDELRDPDISPLYAELDDLPPALFSVGDQDPLLDDSLFMAARWRAAGNDAELKVWPESLHGFTAFPLAVARAANEAQYDFLRVALGVTPAGSPASA